MPEYLRIAYKNLICLMTLQNDLNIFLVKNKDGKKATWYQAVERCKEHDGLHTFLSFMNLSTDIMPNITENIWVANTMTYRDSSKSLKTFLSFVFIF